MPFSSPRQQRYMHLHHPEIASRWEHTYGPPKRPVIRRRRKKLKRGR